MMWRDLESQVLKVLRLIRPGEALFFGYFPIWVAMGAVSAEENNSRHNLKFAKQLFYI